MLRFVRVHSIEAGLVVEMYVMNRYGAFGWCVSKEVCDDSEYFVLPFVSKNMWNYLIMERVMNVRLSFSLCASLI